MSGPYGSQGGGHHGLPHADDHGHFPEESLVEDMGSRAYDLEEHEKENIKTIETRLKAGSELSHHELHEYQHYLEHMTHHIKHILQEEKGSHIHNLELEKSLRKVAQLLARVSGMLEH